jgi:phage gp29-like protein
MKTQLLDQFGRPVQLAHLKDEIAAATIGGVRSPLTGYPGDGLNPMRLAGILREADAGDPVRYLELAETVEERDPHYLGVLGTRRRAVSQLEISVEAASDAAADVAIADELRDWLKRDELTDELFDILDAVGKGFSFTEIIWDTSEGQWMPLRLEYRDPRWFRFATHDLTTPMLIDANGQQQPLPGFKFVAAHIRAKSGLPLRSGIARVALWGWMFKAFTQRDWAIFTQTFGQPVRIGKYGAGATEEDKAKLFQAVANIAGDMAAIVPESMLIEFVESKSIGASSDLYLKRADWLDQQISKAVLGQTATTDAIAGGHAVGKEHREVQEDIERSDAKALSATLTRDLVMPWVQLNHGPQKRYCRIVIKRPESEDLTALASSLGPMIDRGLQVKRREVLERFGFSEPGAGDEVMAPATPKSAPSDPAGGPDSTPPDQTSKIKRDSGEIKRGKGVGGSGAAPQSEGASAANSGAPDAIGLLTDRLAIEAAPASAAMLDQIGAMFEAASSFEELLAMIHEGFGAVDAGALARVLTEASVAAGLHGRADVQDEGETA